jgi:RNA polymerase sigma-70 factor (ECF subfamily)
MTTREYNKCVDMHADGVFRFVLKNLRNEHDAQDIVQDSFEKLWINHRKLDGGKARSYLFTTAYHTMIDHIRKKKAAGSIENLAEQEGSAMFQPYSDLREILDDALDKLNEVQRSLILLRDYEGYSYHEISEITGLNESQVKVYIYRGRMFLKNYIVSPEHVI